MIQFKHVSKSFQTSSHTITALDNVTFDVPAGEICGVIGHSGAGKSTLIRMVNLLERPTAGDVLVDGQALLSLSSAQLRNARRRIGMIFQHFNLLSSRTVMQNVAFPLEIQGYSRRTIEQVVMPLLEMTGLEDKRQQYPSELSGGQQQRVAIARALVTQPAVLLCDEMTSALDPETTSSILTLIQRINRDMGVTILFITHEMSVIKRLADQVLVMHQGRLEEQTNVVDLFRSPTSVVTRQFVQADMQGHLPAALASRLKSTWFDGAQHVWQIAFIGEAATQPVIEALIQHTKVHVNILQADLEYLRTTTIGTMIVGVRGEASHCEQALQYLRDQDCLVKELGYVE